jgi:ATP-dependent DNA ligase
MDSAKLTLERQPFDHPDFLLELTHDGFRALAYISDGHCELVSRRRNSYEGFGELRAHLAGLKVRNAVIDGELVCVWIQKGAASSTDCSYVEVVQFSTRSICSI